MWVLAGYASARGCTQEIAARIAATLEARGVDVECARWTPNDISKVARFILNCSAGAMATSVTGQSRCVGVGHRASAYR